jgi:hypothetical protein
MLPRTRHGVFQIRMEASQPPFVHWWAGGTRARVGNGRDTTTKRLFLSSDTTTKRIFLSTTKRLFLFLFLFLPKAEAL